MNKTEFVSKVAKRGEMSGAEAGKAVSAVLEEISDALKKGEDVAFAGFGKFSVKERKAREGRNPQTGEKLKIAASKVPAFNAGNALKEAV